MKKLVLVLFVASLVLSFAGQAWAPDATAYVTATTPSGLSISLGLSKDKDGNLTSVAADPTQITFDKLDSTDMPIGGSPAYMYAPYRSIALKNWHVAVLYATGVGTPRLTVNGFSYGTRPLPDLTKLKVWFGGFFVEGDDATPDGGGKSADWDALGTQKASTLSTFVGTVPFNYQLKIDNLQGGLTYQAKLTYTLTQS